MDNILFGLFTLLIIVQEIIHHIERRDLYNRLMCRDIKDYQTITKDEKPPTGESLQSSLRKKWMEKGAK